MVAVAPPGKRKCPPEGEHLRLPRCRGGCTWENQIRRFRNRQNLVVIAILGSGADEVKEKKSTCSLAPSQLNPGKLRSKAEVSPLWKSCLYFDLCGACFHCKGAERQGLFIPDPEQHEAVVISALSEPSAKHTKASKPDSHDDAERHQHARKGEDGQEQLG